MGLQVVPGYIGQSGYNHPVELFRNLLKAQTAKGKGYMSSSNDFLLTPSGASMVMNIGSGAAAILGEENDQQGSYFAWSNAAENLAWPAAAGQARIDSLLLRVVDTQYGTDPSPNGAYWEAVTGVPAGSPVARLDSEFLPGGGLHRPGAWWRVADVLVPSGITNLAAGTVTSYRDYADFQRSRVNEVYNWKVGVIDSGWQTYTPTLAAGGGSPTVGGGGVLHGRYKKIGRVINLEGYMLLGSSPSLGTGSFTLSLPEPAATVTNAAWMGTAYYRDVSAAASGHFPGFCIVNSGGSTVGFFAASSNAQAQATIPFTWVATDFARFSVCYEAATA